MTEHPTVPVRVRRVSGELRELRRRHGLAGDEVARALGMSVSKLSRMENGICKPAPDDVSALLGLYRVPAPRRDELLSLVREGQQYNWWRLSNGDDLPATCQDIVMFEREAAALQDYELAVVPGLLQTPEYTRAFSLAMSDDMTEENVDYLVDLRVLRQQNWRRPEGPRLHAIMDEGVCRSPVGGSGVMYDQLRHIVEVARQSKLTVQVLPESARPHPGMEGSFVTFAFKDQPDLLFLENRGSTAFLEDVRLVEDAKQSFRRLRQLALTHDDSVDLIASTADELT